MFHENGVWDRLGVRHPDFNHTHDLMRHRVLGEDQSLSKEASSPVIKGPI